MKSAIRIALLAAFVIGPALPLVGCGGGDSSLKAGPETGPPPRTQADFHKADQEAAKKAQADMKTKRPAR